MPRVTWGNLADGANRQMKATRDRLAAEASWDNPELTTWEDLNNSLDMNVMRRQASWSNLGMTEEEHIGEMIQEARGSAKPDSKMPYWVRQLMRLDRGGR